MNTFFACFLISLAQINLPKVDIQVDLPPPPGRTSDGLAQLALESPGQELESVLAVEKRTLEQIARESGIPTEREAASQIIRLLHPETQPKKIVGIRFALLPDHFVTSEQPEIALWNSSKLLKTLKKESVDKLWTIIRKAAQQERFRIVDQALR
ncbi:MAG: hypothetical protein RJA81_319, partial [Planctomycetota bacterium]